MCVYKIVPPACGRHCNYMRVINSILTSDSPTIFGLLANADVAVQKRAAYVYVCVCMYMYMYMYVCIYIYMYIYICLYVYIDIYVCVWCVCIYICVCV